MATLAPLSNQISDDTEGSLAVAFRDVTFSNSYSTGGESITPANVGMSSFRQVICDQGVGGLLFNFDYTASKLKATYPTGGSTTPATAVAPKVKSGASTASAVDATTPNVVAGIGAEVGSTTDLSAITVRVRFVGKR